nr:unnamed protein product [Callosobruchus analis]
MGEERLTGLCLMSIRPSLEYCSHVWGCAPTHSLKLLDSIQNRAVRLIDTHNLTKDLHSLEHRRRVAGLSLFYRFYHGRCSSELSQIITPKAVRTRNTREALHAHPYQVEVPTPRTSLHQHSFFWKTSTLWNELPGSAMQTYFLSGEQIVIGSVREYTFHDTWEGVELLQNRVVLATASENAGKGAFLFKAAKRAAEKLSLTLDFTPAQLKTHIKAAEVEFLLIHKDKPMHGNLYKHLEEHGLSEQLTFSSSV